MYLNAAHQGAVLFSQFTPVFLTRQRGSSYTMAILGRDQVLVRRDADGTEKRFHNIKNAMIVCTTDAPHMEWSRFKFRDEMRSALAIGIPEFMYGGYTWIMEGAGAGCSSDVAALHDAIREALAVPDGQEPLTLYIRKFGEVASHDDTAVSDANRGHPFFYATNVCAAFSKRWDHFSECSNFGVLVDSILDEKNAEFIGNYIAAHRPPKSGYQGVAARIC